MDASGEFVVTKHPGTGGLVSVGTITAQLLYEIGGPRYLNPDVTARFDSIRLGQEGPDRLCQLLPEARGFEVERQPLPDLLAVNFVIQRLLGEGMSASTRSDPQARSLGEYLRARVVDVPETLLG